MKRGTIYKNEIETKHSGEWYCYFQFSVAGKVGLYYVVGFMLKSVFIHEQNELQGERLYRWTRKELGL